MPAWLFATIYAGIELFLGVTGTLSGIAHFAHLGGMVGSALVVMQWRASERAREKPARLATMNTKADMLISTLLRR